MTVPVLVYIGLAVLYMATLPRKPYAGSYLVKAAPILLLAWVAATRVDGPARVWLLLALLFSAAGDVLLDLDTGDSPFFVAGLGAFLVAHIWYVVAFSTGGLVVGATAWVVVPVVTAAALLLWRLYPRLGRLRGPVVAYVTVIVAMTTTAALGRASSGLLLVGALLFMLSDSLIAVNKFLRPIPARDYLVMATYYAAQCLITLGA